MTGKYPQRVGFTSYLDPNGQSGANSAATHLPSSETTIGETFQQAGYRTGYIGKWQRPNMAYPPRVFFPAKCEYLRPPMCRIWRTVSQAIT